MNHKTFTLKGIVKSYIGNQQNFLNKKSDIQKNYKVLVVEGVFPHNGTPNSDMNFLNLNYEIIKTKKDGQFRIELKPGTYTFFILKGENLYLNNYDGIGNYKHIEVKENIDKYIIRDDIDANF